MEAGWSARRVARQLGRYDCVVRRFRVMSFTLTPDSERPRQTNRREDCHIGRNACVQPTASSDAIQAQAERRVVLLARWIVRNVPLEIVGRSGHEKVTTSGKPGLQRPGRPCDESVRNISTNLLKRLFGKYKFAFISNQLQKDKRDIPIRSEGLDSGAQPVNPVFRVGSNFRIILEQYLSNVENVVEFLEKIDNNLTYYEILKKLACAYLKGHLTRRVLDWFEVLCYRVVKDKATDYVHLKQELSEKFPVDTGADKSFISEEVYRKYFLYRPRQKSKDRVVTAQGAPCCHLGRVELQIRIREFQKTWEFHILNNMQYQCILGIDFMKESKLTLDLDQKYLTIPDDQIKQFLNVEKPVEIDLSDTKFEVPVLQLPNFTQQFNLFTDASGVGIGAVLNQNHRPIAFASRILNKAERNYTVTKRECLAVIWQLNKFKTYSGSLPVKVITDHAALTKLTNGKNLSSPMITWALKLFEINIKWEHRPGVQNVAADVLSRNRVGNMDGSQISCAAL
ncbi:retrovirus-related Pol polyprotein from transposon opus [Trichonephila clavipes]|nr:retrovirus-related Pol polyprotein from transposon opus [Trichonephila clavipes]